VNHTRALEALKAPGNMSLSEAMPRREPSRIVRTRGQTGKQYEIFPVSNQAQELRDLASPIPLKTTSTV